MVAAPKVQLFRYPRSQELLRIGHTKPHYEPLRMPLTKVSSTDSGGRGDCRVMQLLIVQSCGLCSFTTAKPHSNATPEKANAMIVVVMQAYTHTHLKWYCGRNATDNYM